MATDPAQTYTEPELRERLKEQIKAGDKGGKPGQWSARKSQLLVHEYEKAGGGYVDDGHLSPQQEHLKQWGEQDWHTASGDPDAREAVLWLQAWGDDRARLSDYKAEWQSLLKRLFPEGEAL